MDMNKFERKVASLHDRFLRLGDRMDQDGKQLRAVWAAYNDRLESGALPRRRDPGQARAGSRPQPRTPARAPVRSAAAASADIRLRHAGRLALARAASEAVRKRHAENQKAVSGSRSRFYFPAS